MQWKMFLWLLLADRLNTRNMLRHYKIENDDYSCVICHDPPEETLSHLFFCCPFSVECWRTLGISWSDTDYRLHMIHAGRAVWSRPMFMEVFAVAAWGIWKERNDKVFREILPTHNSWLSRFKTDFAMLVHRTKQNLEPFILNFVQTL